MAVASRSETCDFFQKHLLTSESLLVTSAGRSIQKLLMLMRHKSPSTVMLRDKAADRVWPLKRALCPVILL